MVRNVYIEKSQCIILLWYVIFPISILLNPVLTDSERSSELTSDRTECNIYFNESGSYLLQTKEECKVYYIDLEFERSTSIINLTVSIQYIQENEELQNSKTASQANFHITVHELTKYLDKEGKVLLEEWNENVSNISTERNYLSRSSKAFVSISGTGNWLHYNITLFFDEIKHRLVPLSPTNTSHECSKNTSDAWVSCTPNSVSLLNLHQKPKGRRKGIDIWFHELNISTEMGEYLLIGTGTEPFKDKDSRPLYVTLITENSTTFYVDNPSAYVAFISGSTPQVDKCFKILWRDVCPKNTPVAEDPLGMLNSSSICFYNFSEPAVMKEECKKNKDIRFETFRSSFAENAKKYSRYLHQNNKTIGLDKRSIQLIGNCPEKVNGSGSLSFLIKVAHDGKSIFTWRQLQELIEKFDDSTLGFKVGKCPQKKEFELPYKDEWSFVIYAMVPMFGLFALMMWAWKQNIFSEQCKSKKEDKFSFGYMHAEPNPYVTTTTTMTVPKVYRSDDEGRTETLIEGSLQQGETRGAGETTMVEMNPIPSTSRESEALSRFLSSRKTKPRPSIQSLIDKTEENNEETQVGKTEGNESEHLYDSVSSSKQMDETKL